MTPFLPKGVVVFKGLGLKINMRNSLLSNHNGQHLPEMALECVKRVNLSQGSPGPGKVLW